MASMAGYDKIDAPQSTRFARYLIGEIQAGRLRQGETLPSIRAYAEEFQLGRQVVQSAFSILVKKHYVFNKNRSGYYVSPECLGGFYYRIGYFFSRLNPCADGNLPVLGRGFSRYGWTVIPGNNFEEDLECVDWMKHKRDLDGVIVSGKDDISFRMLMHQLLANNARYPFNYSGLKVNYYEMGDLLNPKLPDYRMLVFLASPTRSQQEIDWIRKNYQKDGKVLVFLVNAARTAPGGMTENVQKLTGIRVRLDEANMVTYQSIPQA